MHKVGLWKFLLNVPMDWYKNNKYEYSDHRMRYIIIIPQSTGLFDLNHLIKIIDLNHDLNHCKKIRL